MIFFKLCCLVVAETLIVLTIEKRMSMIMTEWIFIRILIRTRTLDTLLERVKAFNAYPIFATSPV